MVALLTCHAKNTLVLQRQINRSPTTAVQLVVKRNVRCKLDQRDVDDVVTSYKSGKSMRQISEDLSISRSRVSRILKEQGIESRTRQPTKAEVTEMIRLYESGLSLARTGEQVNFDAATVRKYLLRQGVKLRTTAGA